MQGLQFHAFPLTIAAIIVRSLAFLPWGMNERQVVVAKSFLTYLCAHTLSLSTTAIQCWTVYHRIRKGHSIRENHSVCCGYVSAMQLVSHPFPKRTKSELFKYLSNPFIKVEKKNLFPLPFGQWFPNHITLCVIIFPHVASDSFGNSPKSVKHDYWLFWCNKCFSPFTPSKRLTILRRTPTLLYN